jgi:stearoyl-CoA desaturase (delta-9 desaturase)
MHAGGALVFATGVSPAAIGVALVLFFVRAFGLTAGYHRFFAHRSFETSRAGRFALAWLGASAAQMGPLWWAGWHRRHHRLSDRTGDPHSPVAGSGAWAHVGWLLCRRHARAPLEEIADFAAAPELRWLDRFHMVPPLLLALACGALGAWLAATRPELGTSALQMVAVGFFASTLVLYHVTYAVNSLAHRFGTQRYATGDGSRNHPVLALVTLGDGWHNNHHRFPKAARHGFFWWEIDPTWLGLRALETLGFVSNLAPVPREAYTLGRRAPATAAASATSPHATPNESPIHT